MAGHATSACGMRATVGNRCLSWSCYRVARVARVATTAAAARATPAAAAAGAAEVVPSLLPLEMC